jgi:hypothetical protein
MRKRNGAVGAALLLSLCGMVSAEVTSYTLPVTRDGKKTTRLAYEFWSGEYPGPIIDLNSKSSGTTTVPAQASVRDLSEPHACAIQNGVYHPWSGDKKSLITFYTLTAVKSYQSEKDQEFNGQKIKKGDRISHVIYLAEGMCQARWGRPGEKDQPVEEFTCAELDDPLAFTPVEGRDDPFLEQWLYVQCGDGKKAFVQDNQLLAAPGAKEGQLVTYGEVKGAE